MSSSATGARHRGWSGRNLRGSVLAALVAGATGATAVDSLVWTGAQSALWANTANWAGGAGSSAPTASTAASLPASVPATGSNITLPSGAAANGLDFAGSYTLTGGGLTLNGGAVAVAAGKTATLSTAFATPGTFTKSGPGTLTIAGGSFSAGPVVVNADGILQWSAGTFAATNLQLNGGSGMAVDVGTFRALRVNGIGIDVANGSALDLTDNAMVVDYAGASPLGGASGVRALIVSAYHGGDWLGPGIGSSLAWGTGGPSLAVGYAEAAELLGPAGGSKDLGRGLTVDVDGTAVVVRTTLAGDADLSGDVGLNDLVRLANHYGQLTGAGWYDGDFDYNGEVGLNDLVRLSNNYGSSVAGLFDSGADFAADWAMVWEPAGGDLPAAVPEPGALGLVGLVVGAALVRRRHVHH
ncbi:MAG: PEP-CTERM sorting domain-containing protein [Phycisphaerae bacterium]|nr:PEP-CTERM sorting domain-containing protein [Tepidisphaeraceae bacterium]